MKNAINVIDQELIDWFDGYFEKSGMSETRLETQTEDLFQMAKDLIEINAELTKREQYVKALINQSWNGFNAVDLIDELNKILKGDSDGVL